MKISLAFASAIALVVLCAPSKKAMEQCQERHSFETCHFALNR
ncbi:hypothetical protein [Rhizobium sp. 18065]|nr:hypothetical protein [Rhizobium sp. 18065]